MFNKIILFLSSLFIFTSIANAKIDFDESRGNVVVLTSIKSHKYFSIPDYVEKHFSRRFKKSGYKLHYIHAASAIDLNEALTSPFSRAVFWVSHAKGANDEVLGNSDIVQTIDGMNVASVFEKVHPNMRFLGLIGCGAKGLLDKNNSNGLYPNLNYYSFDEKVKFKQGLKDTIKQSVRFLGERESKAFRRWRIIGDEDLVNIEDTSEMVDEGVELVLNFDSTLNSDLIITINKRFQTVLESGIDSQSITLPLNIDSKNKLVIEVASKNEDVIPYIDYQIEDGFAVKKLTYRDGTPVGKHKRITYITKD